MGHYYRGWVHTEQDLDIVLTIHKQQTNSFWGTRQSPDGKRPSARMMWKSQYVPFDGIPFINCGKYISFTYELGESLRNVGLGACLKHLDLIG